jgi:uncharacterized membrane protein
VRRALYPLLALLSLAMAGYALLGYALWPPGVLVHPAMRASFEAHRGVVLLHAFAGALALALGPWQFSARLRARHPRLHRLSGRLYLGLGVGLGGLAGLALAPVAQGGLPGRLGFALLALAWLYTAVHALGAAQQRDFVEHRRWMLRNFALTFAAVTLRLWLPALTAAGVPFERAYALVAWLCWVPNLLAALWLSRAAPPR